MTVPHRPGRGPSATRWPRPGSIARAPPCRQRAEQLDLPVENLITPDLVRRLMWQPPAGSRAMWPRCCSAAGARPWQVELTAGLLEDALHPPAG